MIVKKTPKISVLMPVYNSELYIKEAINSVLNQTFGDFELLIIDDASTDSTVSLLKEFNDPRIRLIEKSKNSGYTDSLNYGLGIAKGEYIARMDGDDISLPNRFEKQVAFLDENLGISLCGSLYSIIGSDEIIYVPEKHDVIKCTLLSHCCFGHPTVMIRKKIFDQFSLNYDTAREPAEDYDLWAKLSIVGSLHNIQEVLLDYRIHDSQVSQKRINQQAKTAIEIRLELLNNLNFESSPEEQDLIRKIFGKTDSFTFLELQQFHKIKDKLTKSNEINFFEKNGFNKFLSETEYNLCKKYFFKRSSYSPAIYYHYIKLKSKISFKLSPFDQLKLFVKSLIFYRVK